MKRHLRVDWNLTPKEAMAQQKEWAQKVVREDALGPIRHVAGSDVGFENHGAMTRAALVVLSCPALRVQASTLARLPTRMPYIPGLLSFREVPALLEAFAQIEIKPDLLICDGHGLAHPRRFGIACHLGVTLDLPTIGIGKSRLVGTHADVPERRGAWVPLEDKGEVIGAVLRTREGVQPIFVSTGHRISLESAVKWALACSTRYRLPEPIRLADRLASGKGSLKAS